MKQILKKASKITLIILSVIFLIILIIIYRTFYKSGTVCDDKNSYIKGEYIIYNCGKRVSEFLPLYSDLSDFENIEFKVFDGRRKTTPLHKYFTNYTLDIKYNADVFELKLSEALSGIEYIDSRIDFGIFETSYIITSETALNDDDIACIAIDKDNYTIRYFVICNTKITDESEKREMFGSLIAWNRTVNW